MSLRNLPATLALCASCIASPPSATSPGTDPDAARDSEPTVEDGTNVGDAPPSVRDTGGGVREDLGGGDVDASAPGVDASDGDDLREGDTADLSEPCTGLPLPVAYWRMESAANSEIPNEVGDVPVTVRSAVLEPGKAGNALVVDNGSVCTAEDHDALDLRAGTISFWFRLATNSDRQMLLSKDVNGTVAGHFEIEVVNNQATARQEDPNGDYLLRVNEPIGPGQWHHFVYVWGPGGSRVYQDASPNGDMNSTPPPGLELNDAALAIGFANGDSAPGTIDSPSEHMVGGIDELAFFDVELSPDQVDLLHDCVVISTP